MFRVIEEGKDILLLKVLYHKPKKQADGKYSNDALTIVYRDNLTKEKRHETIESPKIPVYIAKEEIKLNYPRVYMRKDDLIRFEVSYKNKCKEIAEILGEAYTDYFWAKINEKNRNATNNILKARRVFGADLDIEEYVRIEYLQNCQPSSTLVHKAFYDIEVDIKGYPSFPEEDIAPCPVNAITYVDIKRMEVHTFLLRNPDNPKIAEFESGARDYCETLNDKFDEVLRDKKSGKRLDFKYRMYFFDDEIDLIVSFYKLCQAISPDFLLAWNQRFDKLTLLNRLKQAGIDPADVICHKDFKFKDCYFYKDRRSELEAERGDLFTVSDYTVWLDQMILYAGIRKGGAKIKGGVGLNNIAMIEKGIGKLDYKHITLDLGELPELRYDIFVDYNIRDVLAQATVELKTEDIDTAFGEIIGCATRWNKIFKSTVFLKSMFFKRYLDKGIVMGCNQNITYGLSEASDEEPEEKEKFEGALVGDPTLNGYNGIKINGVASKYVYKNVVDVDLSSLYPSIIRAFNMAPQTIYFKILIADKVSQYENVYNNERYDRGGDMIDDFESRQYINFAHKWLNLPSYEELYNLITTMDSNKSNLYKPIIEFKDKLINPVRVLDKGGNNIVSY